MQDLNSSQSISKLLFYFTAVKPVSISSSLSVNSHPVIEVHNRGSQPEVRAPTEGHELNLRETDKK